MRARMILKKGSYEERVSEADLGGFSIVQKTRSLG
jgi:hypothetical protein